MAWQKTDSPAATVWTQGFTTVTLDKITKSLDIVISGDTLTMPLCAFDAAQWIASVDTWLGTV